MTVSEALELATRRLRVRSLPSPREDSEVLVAWALGTSRTFLYTHPEAELTRRQETKFRVGLRRRGEFYPLQYLIGEQEFFGRAFRVDESTLIPRPETEVLVEAALAELSSREEGLLRAVDVGTGSGCIAVTLACHEPRLLLTGLDISPQALAVARFNAKRWACQERVEFLRSDGLEALAGRGPIHDLIVSNPPYVAWEKRREVDPSVRRYEPRRAVFAAEGGLALYRKLLRQAPPLLKPGGRLAVELGYDLHRAVSALAASLGWAEHSMERDLAGIARCALYERAEREAS